MVGARGGRPEERHAADAAASSCTADAPSILEIGGRDEILTLVEQSAGIGVWDVDLTTYLLRGTAQFFRIMGLQPTGAALPIETTRRLRHPNDRERMAEGFRQAVESGADYFEVEYRITRPDGEMRWIFGRGRVTRDAASVPTRYSGVDIDITDRKRAEAALQDSERRLRELNERLARQVDERASQLASSRAQLQAFFDNSVDWLTLQRATLDGQFVYEDLNPTCASAYGIPREQVIGRTPEDVLGTEAAQVPLHYFRECLRTGQPQRYVARRTLAGRTRTIDVTAVLVPSQTEDGDRFIITSARDITQREQLEAQLHQAQKMEAMGQLTGGVAHDFNNLLAVISGNAELAKRRPAGNLMRMMDNILHASERGVALTRQLLTFSRRQAASPRVIDVLAEMPRIAEMLRASLRGDIEMRVDVASELWNIEVDCTEFEIALLNVAVNARDAMPQGGRFDISVRNVSPGGAMDLNAEHVAIALRDTGVGIPRDVISKIFDPFFTTKAPGEGTGLGLSQVYGFARQSGGVVSIDSQPGVGTIITVRLPRSHKSPASAGEDQASAASRLSGRVLLVEDNPQVATVTAQMLDDMGFGVEVIDRAHKALARLEAVAGRFDLLLSDVVMPEAMNGLDLAVEVRARFPDLPIVLMSGYSNTVAADEATFPVLRKPVPYDALHRMVSTCLRESVVTQVSAAD